MLRFVGGVAAGLAAGCALILLGFAVISFAEGAHRGHPADAAHQPVRLAGAEATRLGGAHVELGLWTGSIREDCRGGCDDLSGPEAVRSVRVLDAAGQCVVCRRVSRFATKDLEAAPLLSGGARE